MHLKHQEGNMKVCSTCHGVGGNCPGCGGSGHDEPDYPAQCEHSVIGLCKPCFEFHKWMTEFYDLIWAKYRPNSKGGLPDGEGHCAFESDEHEKILHNIINAIDKEMGR